MAVWPSVVGRTHTLHLTLSRMGSNLFAGKKDANKLSRSDDNGPP